MLNCTAPTHIVSLERWHRGNDELRMAMTAPSSLEDQGLTYWFKCPKCSFDWPSGFKYSILFVSVSFVTDECPNCRKRQVSAFKVE
jgi:hypothetical protein